ncbi:glutathionylspermidine synthase family protein [Gluconacetobacter takamatsuzukensis]|uniref:Glutathionylspermidine synthase family protein n=1 Tax=Gluconacetobacter takamatsuzukensis TaxID=1286190 RepID=A0A7W4KCZ3_9PROT|nr:glutathionylspermidine synthase family protein [Gluconacetobacter takamatsuzukensis]
MPGIRRIGCSPRPDWQQCADTLGYTYYRNDDGSLAWREDAYYAIAPTAAETLRRAAETLHRMCLALVDEATRTPRGLDAFHIPEAMQPVVRDSWARRDSFLIGRFDFAWQGGRPKLIEYNADTPATLPESTRMQAAWRRATHPALGDRALSEAALVNHLSALRAQDRLDDIVHVVPYPDNREDAVHARYYIDWARQAGLDAVQCELRDLEISTDGRLLHRGRIVRTMIRMYPWELMFRDAGARHLRRCGCRFLNPPWTALLSNKALLPALWRHHPGHPLLLPAAWTPEGMAHYVEKPIHARGGENVRIVAGQETLALEPGTYGDYPRIYQHYADHRIDGVTASIGAWIVGSHFAGITVRESPDAVIRHTSPIVPHLIAG